MSEHTCNKLRTQTFIDFGSDRKGGDKPVPGHEERVLYAQTTLYVPPVDAQDLDAVLQRKYEHHIRLAHKRVALVYINAAKRLEMDIDRLHERTLAHVI